MSAYYQDDQVTLYHGDSQSPFAGINLQWEWFTGFVGPGLWRAPLVGDRQNAWIRPPEDGVGDFHWTVDDNTCGRTLSSGYEETLELAKQAVAEAVTPTPTCMGFQWIGQSFASCNTCGKPFWEHIHEERRREGVGIAVGIFEPGDLYEYVLITDEQKAACKAKWGGNA